MKNITLLLLFIGLFKNTEAATYNFFFNNSEQGDNSNAEPSMTVNSPDSATDGKNEKSKDAVDGKAGESEKPAAASIPVVMADASASKPRERNFRAYAGLMRSSSTFPDQDWTGREARDDDDKGLGIDAMIGLGFYPSRFVGINFLTGTHSSPKNTVFGAVELELLPLAFDSFELGLIGGLWTLPRYEQVNDGFDPSFFGKKYKSKGSGSAYAGAKLGFKVHKPERSKVSWMASVTGRGDSNYFNVDAGISLLF